MFDIHTDGSAMWVECDTCGETIVEYMSLPVSTADVFEDIKEHRHA